VIVANRTRGPQEPPPTNLFVEIGASEVYTLALPFPCDTQSKVNP
jgi:hypothetical protein